MPLRSFYLFVPGIPVPWQRPRIGGYTHKGKPSFFTAGKDTEWRNAIRSAWVKKYGYLGLTRLLKVEVVTIGADSRADADNLFKAVGDALEQTAQEKKLLQPAPAWQNDKQIVDVRSVKFVMRKGRVQGQAITVTEVDGEFY